MKKENNKSFRVEVSDEDQRLDQFLCSQFKDLSRSKIQSLVKNKFFKLNSKETKASVKLKFGDTITYNPNDLNEAPIAPPRQKQIDVEVVHEDDHIIVVNKPAGLITHPGINNTEESLVHALFDKLVKNDPIRPGVVHRLDKETSGLLVLAKTQKSLDHLKAQFKDKTARRIYWALHFGKTKSEQGTWKSNLARSPKTRVKFSSQENGKLAVTHYTSIRSGPVSITELTLDTGRTHQIRVHMSEAHLPILNDMLYGSDKNLNSIQDIELRMRLKSITKMALVARRLSFEHPDTGEPMSFEVPWPREFEIYA